jgi:hypothetical protein
MSASTPLTGCCACGAVRFEVTEPPTAAIYCHCTRCQKRTGGAASVSVRVAPGSVRVVEGEELLRDWSPPGGLAKTFCAGCGGALFARDPDDGTIAVVRMAAFDADPGVRPTAHQFTAYAADWEAIPDDGLPRHPERVPG